MEYNEYLADIEIAKNEMKKMKLYPDNIVADFYCFPRTQSSSILRFIKHR